MIIRTTHYLKSLQVTQDAEIVLSSRPHAQMDAAQLQTLRRGHWGIESVHYVRDVTFHEARSQVRAGSTPQVLAALRNVAIALHRLHGETNMASACRRTAAKPRRALKLLGIDLKKTK